MTPPPAISKTDGLPIRTSGPWIRKKYFYLTRYIDIFTKGMKKKWTTVYIDLFAGPGRCLIDTLKEEVDGSPLISLVHNFSRYIFVEKNEDDVEALKNRCQRSPKWETVEIIKDDCNQAVGHIKIVPTDLALAFIDPTGIDTHFDTIKRLTSDRRVDLLMNISFGTDIKRAFKIYKAQEDHSKLGLFLGGSVDWKKINTPQDALQLYRERIAQLGYSTVKYKDITVKNTKNVPLYFLLFASKHKRGLDFWKKITTKDDLGQLELL